MLQPAQVAVNFLAQVLDPCDEVVTEVDYLYIIKIPEGHALDARDSVLAYVGGEILSESEESSVHWHSLSGRNVAMRFEPESDQEYLNPLLRGQVNAGSAGAQGARFSCCLRVRRSTELQFREFPEGAVLQRLQSLQLLVVCIVLCVLMMIWVRKSCCCMRNL